MNFEDPIRRSREVRRLEGERKRLVAGRQAARCIALCAELSLILCAALSMKSVEGTEIREIKAKKQDFSPYLETQFTAAIIED